MFAIVYQFKFPGVSEAKVAAGFCSESLGGKISEYDFFGLNILSKNLNWFTKQDINNLLNLTGYSTIKNFSEII